LHRASNGCCKESWEIITNMEDIIGYLAAFLTTISFYPQAYKVYKTKRTSELSFLLYLLFTIAVFFWIVYGIMSQSLPVVFANIFILPAALYTLYMISINNKYL